VTGSVTSFFHLLGEARGNMAELIFLPIISKFIRAAYTLIAATFFGLGFGVASFAHFVMLSLSTNSNNVEFHHHNEVFARGELLRHVLVDIQNG
jgi:hypothetical protein